MRVSIAIGLLIVVAIVVFPFRSTYYVTQDDSQMGLLGWREVAAQASYGARVTGRVHFFVSMWLGWIPHAIDRFAYFKVLQLSAIVGNFVALWYLALRLSHNRALALLAGFIALVTMQARWEHNLVSAYPWGFSTSFSLAMIGVALFSDFVERGEKRKQILSACCFFLSLLTYESFVLYSLAFGVLTWPLRHRFAALLRALWMHAACAAFYVGAYLAFRRAFPSQYDGNQVQFSALAVFAVWSAFTRSALPGTAFGDLSPWLNEFSDNYAGHSGSILAAFWPIRIEWFVLVLVVPLLCSFWVQRAATQSSPGFLGRTAVVGLVMACVPQIPLALTPRYQLWVTLGTRSHVPTYFAAFGMALVLACAIVAAARRIRPHWPWTAFVSLALAYVALLTAFSNFYIARSQTIARRKWDLVNAALRSSRFADLPDNAVIFAPSWWHGINIMNVVDDYWTRYLRKKTRKHFTVVRGPAELKEVCGVDCGGRVYFSKYVREGQTGNQYLLFSGTEGDATGEIATSAVDVFVLSANHWFSMYAAISSDEPSVVQIDGLPVTDVARGQIWARIERFGNHDAPFTFRVSSHPGLLDPDSIVLSNAVDGDRSVGTVQPQFVEGFYSEERSINSKWNWGQERARLIFRNDSGWPRDIRASFLLEGTVPSCHIKTLPQGQEASEWSGSRSPHRFETRIRAWSEMSIEFASDCPRAVGDPRNLRFTVRDLQVIERISSGRRR